MKRFIGLIIGLLIMLGAIAMIVYAFTVIFCGEDFDIILLASYETAIFIPFLMFVGAVLYVLNSKEKKWKIKIMKYEFKLKEKYRGLNIWEEKCNCIVDEKLFDYTKKKYDSFCSLNKDERIEYVVLNNLLDDNGEFVRVIQ